MHLPRYLVPFHPKRVPHHFTDVLIIGGGLAGLRAAIAIDPRLSMLVVTKDSLRQSNSQFAQGGIASVMDPEDRFEDHITDTLKAGGDLCDQQVVEMVVRESPERVRELIEWGTRFDLEGGELALGREGGHSHDRIVHALGDATGREVMRAVIDYTRKLPNLQCWENTFTLDLLTHEGACRGALVWNQHHGKTLVWAKQTILCTGGVGQIYRETTNPDVATGDGLALGLSRRRGAARHGVHAVSSDGALHRRQQPQPDYRGYARRRRAPDRPHRPPLHAGVRLASRACARDVVSRSIVSQMEKTRHPNVYLDLSHLDAAKVRARFPGIAATCAEFGLDIARDPIPVRPGAHYMIGGVAVDLDGRTGIPGLWGAGEVTSSGLHGANRLASNSLLEGLVYGAHAGELASQLALEAKDDFHAVPLENPRIDESPEPLDLADIRNSLKSLMWRAVGVRRSANPLTEAAEDVDRWCKYVLPRQFSEPGGWELQNMLTVSRLMIRAALQREETRGVHVRLDFPNTDNAWRRHLTFRKAESEPGIGR